MGDGRTVNRNVTGWLFVAVQAILLVALVLLPGADDWPTPDWLETLGFLTLLAGLAIVGISALGLGSALTATPVPTTRGELTVTGMYRFVRHPIYSGVLLVVVGLTVSSGSFLTLGVAIFTVLFFNVKARWEEARLREEYPNYPSYAARTPRFVPRPRRRDPNS